MIKTREELIKELASEAVNLIVAGRKDEAEELLAKIRRHKEAQGITLQRAVS